MRQKYRHIKKYTPRRRRSNKSLVKQQLLDFERILEMDLSSFLVLREEGTSKQIESARVKMRSDLMKYGSDMEAIGRDLGEGFPEMEQYRSDVRFKLLTGPHHNMTIVIPFISMFKCKSKAQLPCQAFT